jgi:hypothetical protein
MTTFAHYAERWQERDFIPQVWDPQKEAKASLYWLASLPTRALSKQSA